MSVQGMKWSFAFLPRYCRGGCRRTFWLEWYRQERYWARLTKGYGAFRNDLHCASCHAVAISACGHCPHCRTYET